ncbi:hypothetical protein [Streptomyces sp. NPDC007905]|uniref:hypothetical protein n=1 Tax=Streptomyces sp. NPDC007905 TaxID=3364788 RepID=UPI0036E45082
MNAASHGLLSLDELCAAVAARFPETKRVFEVTDSAEVSPFAFRHRYGMDNSRATRLGFTFGDVRRWLPRAVAETLDETH